MKRTTLLGLVFILLSCAEMGKSENLLVIGHRGAMGHVTENSLASIQKAMDLGVDMIEIDVFRIKTGEIVVFHDNNVERLTNGIGNIEDFDLAGLKQLRLNGNHKIPLLEEVINNMNTDFLLNIELKGTNTSEGVARILDHFIAQKGWKLKHFIISSFNWDELHVMRKINPDIAIAVLTEEDPVGVIDEAKSLNAIAINPNYRQLTPEKVKEIHNEGFKVYTWTVNEQEDILQMKDMKVDGIFTNFPERIH